MISKASVGLSKKIGQPGFGSIGASCQVDIALDGNQDTEAIRRAIQCAFDECRQSVEAELATHQPSQVNSLGGQHQPTSPDSGESKSSGGRVATPSQIRAIYAISKSQGVNLAGVLAPFQVNRPEQLGLHQASKVIDQLKAIPQPA